MGRNGKLGPHAFLVSSIKVSSHYFETLRISTSVNVVY